MLLPKPRDGNDTVGGDDDDADATAADDDDDTSRRRENVRSYQSANWRGCGKGTVAAAASPPSLGP